MSHRREKITLILLVSSFVLTGCGANEGPKKSANETRSAAHQAKCETDPGRLATIVMEAAKTDTAEALLSKYGMSDEQFHWFLVAQVPGEEVAEQERVLKSMQLGDLSLEQPDVADCNGVSVKPRKVDPESNMGFEVFFDIICKDGSNRHWKVKLIAFEGCLYLGAID